jgi:phospholipid/cholesterol/gamma-HCH transport system substrate-binding protein
MPLLAEGGRLKAQESEGMTEVLSSLREAIGDFRELSGAAKERIDAVFTNDLGRDLGRVAHAAAGVMEQVESGDGLAHEVIYDRGLSRDAHRMVASGRQVVEDAVGTVDRFDAILAAVKDGDGTLHGLLYRDDGGKVLADLQRSTKKLDDLIDRVRDGDGALHTLIYQQDGRTLIENLSAVSSTLRRLGDEVQQGKGTLGALLKDPSVYEDLKGILGSVRRSQVLRSLVRYTIRHDHLRAVEK